MSRVIGIPLDEDGNPTPRGELMARGYGAIPGYYKMP